MPTSMKRATLFAYQAVAGVPATTPDWAAQYITYPTITPVSTQEVMLAERDSRAMQFGLQPGTLYQRISCAMWVDEREFWRYLVAGAGYGFSGSTHTFTWGDDPASYLTMWRYDGIAGEMRKFSDLVLNKLSMPMDYIGGKVSATLEFCGIDAGLDDLGGISYDTYPDGLDPFPAKWVVLQRDGDGFCPLTATLELDNAVGPLICGPADNPTADQPKYQTPDELQPGNITGTLNVTARYDGYTGSLVEDSVLAREGVYTLTHTDPDVSPPRVATWTFPRAVPNAPGDVNSETSNRQQRQTVNFGLYTGSDQLIATLTVVNGEGALI